MFISIQLGKLGGNQKYRGLGVAFTAAGKNHMSKV